MHKNGKKHEFLAKIDLLVFLARIRADVSMTSLVGSRSDDVMLMSSGDVAGSGWSTGAVTWQDRWTNGRARD